MTLVEGSVSPLHAAALAYASRGWAVFPCRTGQKEPATPHGFQDATTDPAKINAWWTENPDFNIGFDPASAGLSAVDIDAKKQPDGSVGLETWRELIQQHWVPVTYRVRTPGGGWHVYFAGELPTTAGKIAPGIDTRGAGKGYTLLPPSTVNGKAYVEHDAPFAPVPEWIAEKLAAPRYQDQATREYIERSQKVPVPAGELVAMLRHLDPDAGYDQWYRLIGAIRATRLADVAEDDTDARLLEIAQAWSRGDFWSLAPTRWVSDDAVETKFWAMPPRPGGTTFGSLYRAAVAAGYDKPPPRLPALTGAETWPDLHSAGPAQEPEQSTRRRFKGRSPAEYAALPDLEFWDDDKTLPKMPAVEIVFGEWGSHKTNITLTKTLDAILQRGARALYTAGEGALGVGKQRIPAHCARRGVSVDDLTGKLVIVSEMPLFSSPDGVAAFIDEHREFAPNIVVLDTLATAIAGEDENSSKVAAYLTANGPAGRIRDAFGALVVLVAHQGKDAARGVRGNSGLEGNVDALLHVEAHDSGGIKLHVKKMRDGRQGFDVFYKVSPKGADEVPVPERITEQEYHRLAGSSAAGDGSRGVRVEGLLRARGYFGKRDIEDQAMAELVVEYERGGRPADPEIDGEWLTAVAKEKEALQVAARQKKQWAKRLSQKRVNPGGTKLIRYWRIPEEPIEAANDEE